MTLVVRNRNSNRGFAPQTYGFGGIFDDFFDLDPFIKRVGVATDDRVKVKSLEDRHEISIAAPGLKKSDFNIQLKSDKLTISYEACSEESDSPRSFSKAAFSRVWTVAPGTAPEGIKAKYSAGILKVTVMRPENEVPVEHSIKIN